MLPCGTPIFMIFGVEVAFLIRTTCLRLCSYDLSRLCGVLLIPKELSLLSKILWFTVSNALLKSMKIFILCCFLSRLLYINSKRFITASWVDLPLKKPYCWFESRILFFRYDINLLLRALSKILLIIGKRDIGLKFVTDKVLPPLWSGITFAVL